MHWQSLVDHQLPTLISIRRQLHRYPELAFQEYRTARLINDTLLANGLITRTGIAATGVVGLLTGNGRDSRTIAIRADMDALPIQEQTSLPFASAIPNVMHACGHDGHVAIALGAALVLKQIQHHLPGNVKFIFQPAEEGPGGAKPMIEQGVLQDPAVSAIFGFHLTNSLPVGTIGVCYNEACASTNELKLTILGEGGHGAHPHHSVDTIVVAAEIILALQSIASRQVNPLQPFVLTIGTIEGGYTNNAIADQVKLWGTVRTLSSTLRATIPEKIERLVAGITAAHQASYRFEYNEGYPPLLNNQALTALVAHSAATIVGGGNVVEMEPSMGGDDFAYFALKLPACYFRIGSGSADCTFPGHHPQFNFAEAAISYGVKTLVQAVLEYFGVEDLEK